MTLFARLLGILMLIWVPFGASTEAQRVPPRIPTPRPAPLPPRLPPPISLPPIRLPPPIPSLPPRFDPLPPPRFGPPPPPPPYRPQYWNALWQQLDPRECRVRGPTQCEVVEGWRLTAALRDPARTRRLTMELARRIAHRQIHMSFRRSDPMPLRRVMVNRVYRAIQAEFANMLGHIRQTMVEAPAAARARREYAIADAAAVDELQRRVAAESAYARSQAIAEATAYPQRNSVELGSGPAYRQAVAISIGRIGFD